MKFTSLFDKYWYRKREIDYSEVIHQEMSEHFPMEQTYDSDQHMLIGKPKGTVLHEVPEESEHGGCFFHEPMKSFNKPGKDKIEPKKVL